MISIALLGWPIFPHTFSSFMKTLAIVKSLSRSKQINLSFVGFTSVHVRALLVYNSNTLNFAVFLVQYRTKFWPHA